MILAALCFVISVLPTLAISQWYSSTVALPEPTRDASSAIIGTYVAVIGGCQGGLCDEPMSTITLLDPSQGIIYNSSLKLSAGIMGGSFAVSTHDPLGDKRTLYLFRACTRLVGNHSAAHYDEVVRVVVDVSENGLERLEVVEPVYRLPRPIANASCVSRGSSVFIIGGVDLLTGIDRATIDVVDVSRKPSDDAFYVVGVATINATGCNGDALHFPAVTANNAAIFVALRCGTAPSPVMYDFSVAVRLRVIILYPDFNFLVVQYVNAPLVPSPVTSGADVHMFAYGSQLFLTGGSLSFFTVGSPTSKDTSWMTIVSSESVTGGFSSLQLAPMRSPNGNSLFLYAFGGIDPEVPESTVRAIQTLELSLHTASILSVHCEGRTWSYQGESIKTAVIPPFLPWSVRLSEEPQHSNVIASVSPFIDCAVRTEGFPLVAWMSNKDLDFSTSNATNVAFVCLTTGEVYRVVRQDGDVVGTYELRYAINSLSPLQFQVVPTPPSYTLYWIIGFSCLGVVVVAALLFVIVKRVQRTVKLSKIRHQSNRIQLAVDHILSTNKFEIIRHIGSGGCAEVFLVQRRTDQRQMACKHIRCQKGATRDDIMRESDLLKRLAAHPNTVRIIETILSEQDIAEEPPAITTVQGNGVDTVPEFPVEPEKEYSSLPHLPLLDSLIPTTPSEESALLPSDGNVKTKSKSRRSATATFQCIVMEYYRQGDLASHIYNLFHRGVYRTNRSESTDSTWAHVARRTSSLMSMDVPNGNGPSDVVVEKVIVSVALQLTYFLKYLHSRQPFPIVHGDLKPENVLIANTIPEEYMVGADTASESGGSATSKSFLMNFMPIVVTDFASSQEIRPDNREMRMNSRSHTPPYVSPECFQSGLNHVSCAMDVWAVGCIVYAMATDTLESRKSVFVFELAAMSSFENATRSAITERGYSVDLVRLVLLMLEFAEHSRPSADDLLSCFQRVGVCEYTINAVALTKLEELVRAKRQTTSSHSKRESISRMKSFSHHSQAPRSAAMDGDIM